ncbi:dihydrofolate reductase family protein [Alloacidobacterium sp.]|uniref:dihydrofolate reductase family protein n=1 Tax=Alloacidobacterium sp. TaxID=2951999 RepID=UPI002D43EDEA|nr:dihydrofolate reductase family protein [Alloacidobacterium sp.]HYK35935.1 dihydrofolate reductase family protein [Alloacidobacterium sp.]
MSTRKIIVEMAISADGFIARSDGSVDWLERPSPEGHYGMVEFYKTIDTILWGRKTYDMALDFQKKGIPGSAFDTKLKNYVFTRGPVPSEAPAGVEFVEIPIKEFANNLRKQVGKDIWMMGGAGIIASFLDEGEIDEFVLTVIPTFIGEGIPMVAPARRNVSLKLISSTNFPDDVVKLHYAVTK